MKRNKNDSGRIPEINVQKIIELNCDLCNETMRGRVYDHDAWKKNTQILIDAITSGDKEKSKNYKFDIIGWVCPYCGFTTCKANKHSKELGIKFWSFEDPTCIRCKKKLPESKKLLIASKKKTQRKENGLLQRIFSIFNKKSFKEKDNLGTRHDSASETAAYWFSRNASSIKDPFVIYTFESEKEAKKALLELPCIHTASDSGKLICTETLMFGCYKVEGGEYEAILCGGDLKYELWEKAKKSFIKYGGRPKGQGALAPKKKAVSASGKNVRDADQIRFVRKDREKKHMGNVEVTFVYEMYQGPNAASAKEFLAKKSVSKQHYYIVVETPEGNYGRDIDGIYKE